MSALNQPDAINLIDRLESENRKLRALNAELLTFIKEQLKDSKSETDYEGVSTFNEGEAIALIAKAEGKCAN